MENSCSKSAPEAEASKSSPLAFAASSSRAPCFRTRPLTRALLSQSRSLPCIYQEGPRACSDRIYRIIGIPVFRDIQRHHHVNPVDPVLFSAAMPEIPSRAKKILWQDLRDWKDQYKINGCGQKYEGQTIQGYQVRSSHSSRLMARERINSTSFNIILS